MRDDRVSSAPARRHQRTAAQKDRDRVLYSLAFRRLATVTQVVGPLEGYIFHNRLTHTLEVAQIARRLAECLRLKTPAAANDIDPDVVECAAMAHDLGHPPFGHAAEDELKRIARAGHLADGFEGNAQSFRIITRLAELSPTWPNGLDLTRASLNAVLKYPWPAGTTLPPVLAAKQGKYGVYDSDMAHFNFARALGPAPLEQCVEAQIMDLADDIAYSVHDVDDFYRAGHLPLDQLATDRAQFYDFLTRWQAVGGPSIDLAAMQQLENLLSLVRLGLPYSGTRAQRAGLRAFTSTQIGNFVNAVTLAPDPVVVWRAAIDPARRLDIAFLKRLVWDFVITNPRLASLQAGQRRIIRELVDIYHNAITTGHLDVIPPLFRYDAQLLYASQQSQATDALRLAIDIVASFGDEQATVMAHRLMGVEVGSVRDALGP